MKNNSINLSNLSASAKKALLVQLMNETQTTSAKPAKKGLTRAAKPAVKKPTKPAAKPVQPAKPQAKKPTAKPTAKPQAVQASRVKRLDEVVLTVSETAADKRLKLPAGMFTNGVCFIDGQKFVGQESNNGRTNAPRGSFGEENGGDVVTLVRTKGNHWTSSVKKARGGKKVVQPAKPAAKPAKQTAKPAAKPVQAKKVAKPVQPAKPAAKPVAKPAVKKPAAKPVQPAKPVAKKLKPKTKGETAKPKVASNLDALKRLVAQTAVQAIDGANRGIERKGLPENDARRFLTSRAKKAFNSGVCQLRFKLADAIAMLNSEVFA